MPIVIATRSVVVAHKGQRVPIRAGSAWDGDDSIVAAYPDVFSTDARFLQRTDAPGTVEAATRAPGERRTTRRA
jgi:hypothetical protein